MHLRPQLHLAYCTNIHRGEDWRETFGALQTHVLAVRDRVCPDRPYAIGLRLSDRAARELSEPITLRSFQEWLGRENCYIFTVNGFPYGRFHGTRVKEQVYAPDWTTPERVEYTNRLFDLLAELVPEGVAGSVSTVPGSFKAFIQTEAQVFQMRQNLWRCIEHAAALGERSGKHLHLGLEPEPLCFLENSEETIRFFEELRMDRPNDERLERHLGVNYDTCHFAVEFEEPAVALDKFKAHRVPISKVHLSSALMVQPTPAAQAALAVFADDIYLHQVIERRMSGDLVRYTDLDLALRAARSSHPSLESAEWRIHFHIPLHYAPAAPFRNTTDHLLGVLDRLGRDPSLCSHLEMETYTWEVMPRAMKERSVVEQLASEYAWTLRELAARGLG